MKRFVFNIVASLFCISAFAQTVDMQFDIPKFTCIKTRFTVKPFENSPLFSDTLICKSSLPFTSYLLPKKIISNDTKPSVVINTSYKNLSAPTFSQPYIQTMNWWQVLVKAGIGLTRGLAFGDYNSDFTLDD